jgi:hypothetical protein
MTLRFPGSILQDADVVRELEVAARGRAYVLWLAKYFRDQKTPYDTVATERAARESILADITNYLRKS